MKHWVLVALPLLLLNGSCGRHGPAPEKAAAVPSAPLARSVRIDPDLIASGRVTLAPVSRRAPKSETRIPGDVRANEGGSAEAGTLASGRVATLIAKEGSRVERGQVLAWVDSAEASRAAADFLRARARVTAAARHLQRQLKLQEQAATSAGAVDEARAEEAVARADLAAARTLLWTFGVAEPPADTSEAALSVRVPVRAPIAGVVARRDAVLGAAVAADKSLFHIVAVGQVFVAANMPETMPVPAEGSGAVIVARGRDGARCDANVAGSMHLVDDTTRTVPVRLQPAGTCEWLVPGGYVDVLFSAPAHEPAELVVPSDALVDIDGVPTAFVAVDRDPGRMVARGVRVRATGGPDTVVEAGLAEGDLVATTGALLLKGELLRTALEGP
jgi:cobalt-zinc-cadmium efflux system membrane fusion protein